MVLKTSADLRERFPGLRVLVVHVNGVRVETAEVGGNLGAELFKITNRQKSKYKENRKT